MDFFLISYKIFQKFATVGIAFSVFFIGLIWSDINALKPIEQRIQEYYALTDFNYLSFMTNHDLCMKVHITANEQLSCLMGMALVNYLITFVIVMVLAGLIIPAIKRRKKVIDK